MKKTTAINENRHFRALYSRGRTAARKTMAVYARKGRQRAANHLGITVSVKLGGAVRRNRAKRRLKEAYRLCEDSIQSGIDLVIVARHAVLEADFDRIKGDLMAIMKELGLLETAP